MILSAIYQLPQEYIQRSNLPLVVQNVPQNQFNISEKVRIQIPLEVVEHMIGMRNSKVIYWEHSFTVI